MLWYNFLKAWKGDPGIVVATADVQMRTIVQLAEKGAEKGIVNIICVVVHIKFTIKTLQKKMINRNDMPHFS